MVTVATVGQSSPATAAIPAAIASGSAMPMRGWTTRRPAALWTPTWCPRSADIAGLARLRPPRGQHPAQGGRQLVGVRVADEHGVEPGLEQAGHLVVAARPLD